MRGASLITGCGPQPGSGWPRVQPAFDVTRVVSYKRSAFSEFWSITAEPPFPQSLHAALQQFRDIGVPEKLRKFFDFDCHRGPIPLYRVAPQGVRAKI